MLLQSHIIPEECIILECSIILQDCYIKGMIVAFLFMSEQHTTQAVNNTYS